MDLTKIHARIARCLALAAAAEGAEAATAYNTAAAIAAKYGVDIATIKAANPVDAAIRVDVTVGSRAMWRAALGWRIAAYVGVTVIRSTGTSVLHVIGRATDIASWKALYDRSEAEIEVEAMRYLQRCKEQGYGGGRSDSDTFRKAAAQGFGDRLCSYREEAARSEQGQATAALLPRHEGSFALVMIGRSLAVKAKEVEEFPHLHATRYTANGSSEARRAGYAFGSKLGVHKASVNG